MAESRQLRVGLIGFGLWGPHYARILAGTMGSARLAACAEPAAARLAAIPDDCHRPAASNFAARQNEPSLIMMKVYRQNCTHHGVGGRTKQAFEFR